jgi:hypothetical protein
MYLDMHDHKACKKKLRQNFPGAESAPLTLAPTGTKPRGAPLADGRVQAARPETGICGAVGCALTWLTLAIIA